MEIVYRVLATAAVALLVANILGPLVALAEILGAGFALWELFVVSAGIGTVLWMLACPFSEFVRGGRS